MESITMFETSMTNNVIAAAPYSLRPPSPPFIHIPPTGQGNSLNKPPRLTPSYTHVNSSLLTHADIDIITQNKSQVATDKTADWSYELRRKAQPVVDFIYVGPTSVVRNHAFLKSEGITMILVARDARMSSIPLMSVEKAASELGLEYHYVDIEGCHQTVSEFSGIIYTINNHMLSVYHSQARGSDQGGDSIDPSSFRRGKVLITCESGNDRSAAIVAAYLMAMFKESMVHVLQFINAQRFCCIFDEDIKRKLQSWEDLLAARAQVAQSLPPLEPGAAPASSLSKRHIDEIDMDELTLDDADQPIMDRDRFEGRDAFAPFMDQT